MADARILVVDDEPGVRTSLESILVDEGYQVVCAETGEEGLEKVGQTAFDAVLLDVWLPGIDGLETLTRMHELAIDAEVVMISGHGTIETAVRATKLGAFDFVEKPLSLDKTLLVLRNALRQRKLERTNRRLLAQLSRDTEIVGQSAGADRLRRETEIAAASNAPVLLSGEPGSGREMLARGIHAAGSAAEGPFVEVRAASLDAATAETVLFGEDGLGGRLGLALGGVLFLDDADRLPPRIQTALAERSAGDDAPRLIVSTSAAEALAPELRQQVDVCQIAVPALRERREDVPLLADRFMQNLAREYGRPARKLADAALAALTAHSWPGNVHELQNLIERLFLFAPDDSVELRDLPESLGGAHPPSLDLYGEFDSLAAGVAAFERYYVGRVLADEGGDREAASRRLGLSAEDLGKRLARRA